MTSDWFREASGVLGMSQTEGEIMSGYGKACVWNEPPLNIRALL